MRARRFAVFAVLTTALSINPGLRAQLEDFSIGGMVADTLSEAFASYQQMQQGLAQATQDIRAARARFWKAYPNGKDLAASEQAFADQLWMKDVFHLMWTLPEGLDGPAAFNRIVTSKMDNGIPPLAYPAFKDLVNDVRLRLGARNRTDPVIVFNPVRTMEAFLASAERLRAYVRLRDFAEFEASGVNLSKMIAPKPYALRLIESQLSGWEAGIPRPDPVEESLEVYDAMARMVGEPQMLAAAARVLAAPKDARGSLSPAITLPPELGGGSVSGTFFWFTRLLATNPRAYAAIAMADVYPSGTRLQFVWKSVATRYDALVKAHGEAAVLKAAERVRLAPKDPALGRIGNAEPASWIATLAGKPETPLPASPKRTSVADFEAFKAGVKDATITVTGTVSRVTIMSGGGALEYAVLHFKESPDSRVTARIMYTSPENLPDFVGKTLEITSDYWMTDGDTKATLRVVMPGQLTIPQTASSRPQPAPAPTAEDRVTAAFEARPAPAPQPPRQGAQPQEPARPQRGRGASTPAPNDQWWTSMLGTWSGPTQGPGPQRTITVQLTSSPSGLAAHVRSSDGFGAEAVRAHIVSGTREVTTASESRVVLDARVSPDGKTLQGRLTVWFWSPKTVTVALAKGE